MAKRKAKAPEVPKEQTVTLTLAQLERAIAEVFELKSAEATAYQLWRQLCGGVIATVVA